MLSLARLRRTRDYLTLDIIRLCKPVAMEKTYVIPAKIHTVML